MEILLIMQTNFNGSRRSSGIKSLKIVLICILLIIGISPFTNKSYATSEIENETEMMAYIRELFSDTKVLVPYTQLIKDGYYWKNESGNFGSMLEGYKDERFIGQIRILMQNKGKSENILFTINFVWSRKKNKIVEITNVTF